MSLSPAGSSDSDYWLQRLFDSYKPCTTGDGGATPRTSDVPASGPARSFGGILSALLSDDGSSAYNADAKSSAAAPQGEGNGRTVQAEGATIQAKPVLDFSQVSQVSRNTSETKNDDGSTTSTVTLADADGHVVGTKTTTTKPDGSFTSTIAITGASGLTATKTITGENTAQGLKVSSAATDADGNPLVTDSVLFAADGGMTRTHAAYGADGSREKETSRYDADGRLLSTDTASIAADGSATYARTLLAADGSSTTETSRYDAAGKLLATFTATSPAPSATAGDAPQTALAASEADAASPGQDDGVASVAMAFTSEGMEQTTTVTDADGRIVSRSTRKISFADAAGGEMPGSSLDAGQDLSHFLDRYAASVQEA